MDNVTAQFSQASPSQGNSSYVDAYVPPTSAPVTPTPAAAPSPLATPPSETVPPRPASSVTTTPPAAPSRGSQSEELEDQNIFAMLGVTDGSAEQRESFLDELQQVIWEDFLEYDVKLLVTRDEQAELQKILAQQASTELEKQEKVVIFLEKLIPDLEEIMLEKALELKEEMMRERLKGMREYYKDKTEALEQIKKAEEMMNVGKWHSAATLLNSIR